jgi:hypothetical protein
MPTTQKSPQKQTKATQKVGGSAKKPVTKAIEGGKGKVAVVKSKDTTRGGSAKGSSFYIYEDTKKRSIKNENDIIELKKVIPQLVKMIRVIYNVNCRNLKREYPEEILSKEFAETVMNLEIDYGEKGKEYRSRKVCNRYCEPLEYPYGFNVNNPKGT